MFWLYPEAIETAQGLYNDLEEDIDLLPGSSNGGIKPWKNRDCVYAFYGI
ncbi:hypothetical protein [Candidatus Neptunichlamydia sp. REUL1]|nr:hypothetical protein [Candidatus Neptunochlamydia sp. REUL1]